MSKAPKIKGVICLWCETGIILANEGITFHQAREVMKEHDLTCSSSPLVQENAKLRQKIAELEGR